MSKFNLNQSIQILRNTPAVLRILLCDLSEDWITQNEGGESWSPYDIVGHFIHGEKTDWVQRAKIILEFGKSKPFTPFDRFAQVRDSAGKGIKVLLDEFELLRSENLNVLSMMKLQDNDLKKEGIHPELGIVTLKQLIATWVIHDLSHIRQISRVMAKNYKDEIGPWQEYLPVVNE